MKTSIGIAINELGSKLPILFASTTSTLALSLFFTSATAASGTVTDVDGTGNSLTFTRASVAKYWNASGVLSEAASGIARVGASNRKPVTNLVLYPEQWDNAAWTNSNTSESGGQADPFGGTNAFKLTELDTAAGSTHYIEATTGIAVQAKVYTHSVYVKAGERTWVRLGFATAAGVAFFNLSTGAVGTTSGLDGYGIAPVEGVAGWYRVWITDTLAAGTDKPRITLAEADNDVAYDGDGSSGLYIFGAMLNEGGIEDYIGGTTGDAWYTAGEPTTGFVKVGYTAEAAATNLVTDSEDFGAAAWTINNTNSLTVTANSIAAPDGTTTMDLIDITDTANETHLISDSITISSATDYAISCFAKANEHRYVGINLYISSENFATVVYDLLTGTVAATDVGTTSGTVTASGVIPTGDGQYRIWASLRVTGTAATIGLAAYNSASPTFDASGLEAFAGTAGNGFYAWGMQVEVGTYPSSYMKTSGGTFTRAADVLYEASGDPAYDPAVGTIVVEAIIEAPTFNARYAMLSNNAYDSNRMIDIYQPSTSTDGVFGASTWGITQAISLPSARRSKNAAARADDDAAFCRNGALVGVDTSTGTAATTVTRMSIGNGAGSASVNGHIRSLAYYSERKSDADLATLSTITDDGTSWVTEQSA